MSYQLSVLDKSPVAAGENATQALARSLKLAQLAEKWGYKRFWVAEHHNSEQLASPSPELLIAWIAAQTRTIRVGSGGVMLQHYSPYKVAENFNLCTGSHRSRRRQSARRVAAFNACATAGGKAE